MITGMESDYKETSVNNGLVVEIDIKRISNVSFIDIIGYPEFFLVFSDLLGILENCLNYRYTGLFRGLRFYFQPG